MKWLHVFLAILLGLCIYLAYNLWFDPEKGRQHLAEIRAQLEQQQLENKQLKKRNKKLELNISSLKTDYDAREELARKNLGLIQKDETFFHISPDSDEE